MWSRGVKLGFKEVKWRATVGSFRGKTGVYRVSMVVSTIMLDHRLPGKIKS